MKLAELLDARQKSLGELEKRMAAAPSAEMAQKLGEAGLEAKVQRIKERIARLKSQREVAVARIDAALVNERAALAAVERLPRPGLKDSPAQTQQPGNAPPEATKVQPGATRAAAAKTTKVQSAAARDVRARPTKK
jgi:hypothetical protein